MIEILSRDGHGDWGGRIGTVRIVGSMGSRDVSGDAVRSWLGLRSSWFVVTSAPAVSAPAFPRDVTDYGLADVVAVTPKGMLQVSRGTGDGRFGPPMDAGHGWGSLTLVRNVGPFGPDTRSDLIGRRADGSMWLYAGSSSGAFVQPPTSLGHGWNSRAAIVVPGDWDGDRHTDLMAVVPATGRLWLYRGRGDGTIVDSRPVGTGWNIMRTVLAAGDVTGDGHPDVLALQASNGTLYAYPGNGHGGWLPRRAMSGGFVATDVVVAVGDADVVVAVGDADGDGRNDILVRRAGGLLYLYAETGDGGLRPGRLVGTGWGSVTLVP